MNPYQVLGIRNGAPLSEVKKAYRNEAKKVHPDINPSQKAHIRFIQLNEAYNAIINQKENPQQNTSGFGAHSFKKQEEDIFEKYKNVYSAPINPKEYQEWRKVAQERAKQFAKEDSAKIETNVRVTKRIQTFLKYAGFILGSVAVIMVLELYILPSKVNEQVVQRIEFMDQAHILVKTDKKEFVSTKIHFPGQKLSHCRTCLLSIKYNNYFTPFPRGFLGSNKNITPHMLANTVGAIESENEKENAFIVLRVTPVLLLLISLASIFYRRKATNSILGIMILVVLFTSVTIVAYSVYG